MVMNGECQTKQQLCSMLKKKVEWCGRGRDLNGMEWNGHAVWVCVGVI